MRTPRRYSTAWNSSTIARWSPSRLASETSSAAASRPRVSIDGRTCPFSYRERRALGMPLRDSRPDCESPACTRAARSRWPKAPCSIPIVPLYGTEHGAATPDRPCAGGTIPPHGLVGAADRGDRGGRIHRLPPLRALPPGRRGRGVRRQPHHRTALEPRPPWLERAVRLP